MLSTILNQKQQEILRQERRTIQQLLTLLAGWEAQPKDIEILQQALEQLDELFLLVVVGEFNSGKSALINALLGERYLAEGVTPTTAQIHILRHGPKSEPYVTDEGIWVLTYPADFLRDLSIVDTPGTNAVLRQHEEISRDFVPRSDLVIFITSADRPFTESEREFLETIRNWGKKVIIVINKIDLLATEQECEAVVQFVRQNAVRLLGITPEIFPLSARKALRAKESRQTRPTAAPAEAGAPPTPGENGSVPPEFGALERYLLETLNQESRIRLKLASPLGVALRVAQQYEQKAAGRLQLLNEDLTTVEQVERQLDLYRRDMAREFESHLLRIDRILGDLEDRGEQYFDETFKITRIFSLLNSSAIRQAFEREVVANTPEQIERQVQDVIDWMVERESRQWRAMARQLGQRHKTEFLEGAAQEAAGGFEYNRRQLLQNVGQATAQVVARYDKSAEARALVDNVQASLAQVAILEVGAVGLGAVLKAVLVGAAADATGLLAAGVIGVAGLGIIPYKRQAAKKDLRVKLDRLKAQLHQVLHEAFETEIEHSVHRLNDAVDPYSRFVRTEHERLTGIEHELETVQGNLRELRAQVGA
ncbi:MAG TPA: dynamin [Chloroflexi bacterium]|nr:dynamin [Chloroflexota bacterium]